MWKVAMCTDLDGKNWEENFMAELGNKQDGEPEKRESSDEFDGGSDMPNKVKT